MTCKLCPTRKHCWDKGNCENCDYGKAFEKLAAKNKRLKAKNTALQAENEELKKRAELPCKVGDKIYNIYEADGGWHTDELTVTEVATKRIFCSGYEPPRDDLDCELPIDEMGKTVFLTPEAAQEEIKKRTEAHSIVAKQITEI